MTDTAMGLLREAVKVIDSLDAIIAGEISNDWADFFGKDWEDMYDIKSRITALLDSGKTDATIRNEALELAARECEKNMMATGVPMILLAKAVAIRGLKVE